MYVHALQNVLGGYGWIADFHNSHTLFCVPTSIHPDFILRLSVVSRIRKSIELINHFYWFIYELIKKWTTEQHSQLKSLRSHLLSLVHVFLGIIPVTQCDCEGLSAAYLLRFRDAPLCSSPLSHSEFSSFVHTYWGPFLFSSFSLPLLILVCLWIFRAIQLSFSSVLLYFSSKLTCKEVAKCFVKSLYMTVICKVNLDFIELEYKYIWFYY